MMKKWFALLLAAMLLAGCTAGQPETTAAPPVQGWEPVGEGGNLWYVPNETVESMKVRQLLDTGDGLLLSGSDGTLALLSTEDLSLRAQTALELSDQAMVQVLEDGVGIADPGRGTVTILTSMLEVSDVRQGEPEEQIWLLSPDGQTIYQIADEGIYAVTNGHEQQLMQTRMMSPSFVTEEVLWFAAIGTEDLVVHWYGLDLADGVVRGLEGTRKTALSSGLLPLEQELYLRLDDRVLTLCDAEGGFVSCCSLPEGEMRGCGSDFVWNDTMQGWFFIDYDMDGGKLMFWDTSVETKGAPIDLMPETAPEGSLLDAELYERAAGLSEQYGLDIRIADRCIRDYRSYTAEMLTDPELISSTLDILEEALGRYPEGFFRQLWYSNVETIRIEIVDELDQKKNTDVSDGDRAFSQQRKGYYLIVLNGRYMRESVIFHEIAHIIDKRVSWEAMLREGALYTDADWMALQPEGFEYADSYQHIPDSVKAFYDSGYFVQDYSCVSASEDKALLLEKAMLGEQSIFDANPHLMPKLRYYCDCIRDSFDTSGWPERVLWEQLLP